MQNTIYVTRALLAAVITVSPLLIAPGPAAAAGNVYYVAPNGNDRAAGTQTAPWATIARAQNTAKAGDTVYFRGGRYVYTRATSACSSQTGKVDAITLNKSGASGNPIRYWAQPGEKPVFDFSGMKDDCRIKGFAVTGSHLHLKGLEVTGVPQNNNRNAESWGIWISGDDNVFEQIDTHHHMGPGLFISGGSGNLVLDSDSHENYDRRSSDGPGENADGFGSHYTPAGRPSNVFRGCRAWWNSDDGFDLIHTYSSVIIESSWSWRNGYVPGTTTSAGNGAGFKMGGFGAKYDAGAVKHTVRFSVAFNNKAAGFYSNHHPVANDYFDNTSYGNRPDFDMLGIDANGKAVGRGTLRNNIAYTGTLLSNMNGTTASHNSWNLGLPLSDAQFRSVSTSGWDAPRQADGSLPVLPHLRLAANSTLIDKGTAVGLPYHGSAPDLGAFESDGFARPAADEGMFQTITNDTFWNDTNGNPIYSQGGGVFKFGDTYYWYGVHYTGAELYRANPTKKFDGDVGFVSIPVYSSKDLVNWKFENDVATRSTRIQNGATLGQAGWVGRLGVSYNENTGKYVLAVQAYVGGEHGVLLLRGDSPTGAFGYGYFQTQIVNSPTTGTGDQTVFTDDDGKDYLIFSNRSGRGRAFVAKFRESDSLRIEPAVQISSNSSGREGNAMFKLGGKYYHAASDLHGWNSSVTHVVESSSIQSGYSGEYTLAGTEMDYSHVTQTGFFVTVKGTKQTTVIFAGDRWADFAWNGIGYNQWMPVTKSGARPEFHSVSQWQFNATTGEWRVGPQNNYVLNPDFQADRITVSTLTGWTNFRESGASDIVTNVNGGANGSRFGLRIGATSSFAGGVRQRVTIPAGNYKLGLHAKTSGSLSAAQVTITDAAGASRTLTIPASSGWTRRDLANIPLAAGTATVTIRAAGGNGYLFADALSLVRTS